MVFSSSVFLILFLPITVLLYYNPITEIICKKRGNWLRNVILLLGSLVFYAWGEPIYVFLMLISILVTYAVGIGVSSSTKSRAKIFLVIGILFHVLLLFIFKYLGFVLSQISLILHRNCDLAHSIALPIGISFYSFQLMSYLFDVYYENTKVQKNVIMLALYATMFPQLIAGPIVRYNEIEKEIKHRDHNKYDFYRGTERFIFGLGKKVLLADYLAYAADSIWNLNMRTPAIAWIGAVCYTFQIYFDFSGYSDMAIGLGNMFGFHFSENFNYPYISKSVTEFWRRWHISLSTWFRDYVYIPMGGNRVSKPKWIKNIFVVWLLTGIWHGANWTFIAWGMLYFVVLMIERRTDIVTRLGKLSHIYTLLVVVIAWVIFRSDSISKAGVFIGELFGLHRSAALIPPTMNLVVVGVVFPMVVAAVLSTPVFPALTKKMEQNFPGVHSFIRPVTALLVFCFSLAKVMSEAYTAFIYFNF